MTEPNRLSPVVITGQSLVSCLGLDTATTWHAVRHGACGIGPMTAIEQALEPDKGGGQAPDLPEDFEPQCQREVRYLRWALDNLLRSAGLAESVSGAVGDGLGGIPAHRCAVVLGTTLHGMRSGGRYLRTGDLGALQHFLAGSVMKGMLEGVPISGLTTTTCSACSSALAATGLGITLLRSGRYDLVIAGGYDPVSEYVYAGFNSLRLIAEGPQRPFAKDRQGMKTAEGYALVALQREDDARQREAPVFARILGCGESSDAHHLTKPHQQGDGAALAIRRALADACLTPSQIDLISAHGTATPDNDAAEYAAFEQVFGESLSTARVVTFKGNLGHTLGAAGLVELILSGMALQDQVVPAAVNVGAEEVAFPKLSLVTGSHAVPCRLRTTLNTSLGFGGANACVILGAADSSSVEPVKPVVIKAGSSRIDTASDEVWITGIGVVTPDVVGASAFVEWLNKKADEAGAHPTAGQVPAEHLNLGGSSHRVGRISPYARLTLASAYQALKHAGIDPVGNEQPLGERGSVILGTDHGATPYCERYYRQIVQETVQAAHPLLFAEGVPNVGSAHMSIGLGIRGSCQSLIGSRTAGLDALQLGWQRVRAGQWDRVLVGAAEEYSPVVQQAYQQAGLRRHAQGDPGGDPGLIQSGGAVTVLLEKADLARQRGASPLGKIVASAQVRMTHHDALDAGHGRRFWEDLGSPSCVLTACNGGWMDLIETKLLRQALRETSRRAVTWSTCYGYVAEMFSVGPLVTLAACLLTGRPPRPLIDSPRHGSLEPADSQGEPPEEVAVVSGDCTGVVTGVAVRGVVP